MGEPLFVRVSDPAGSVDLEVMWAETFGDVAPGQPLLFEDSYGRLSIAVNQGSASEGLGVREDAEVIITRGPLAPALDGGMEGGYDAGFEGGYDPGMADPALVDAGQWTGPGWEGDPNGYPQWQGPEGPPPER
jgi:hypothetical protein